MKISRWPDHPRNLAWHRDDKKGTHVPLPLDVSQVSDEVVAKVESGIEDELYQWRGETLLTPREREAVARAAIAALAAALAQEAT
jgi:hypothetical protein